MILVVGGGRRIGKALVDSYSKTDKVLFTYYSSEGRRTSKTKSIRLDLRDVSAIREFCASLKNRSISTLLYVASTFDSVRFGETTEAEWNDLIDVNLKAAYFLCEAIRPKLMRNSNIQFFNDVLLPGYRPEKIPYAVAKGGLSILMQILARSWAPEIRVNEIGIGYALPPTGTSRAEQKEWLKQIPLGRFSGVEPIVAASHFLTEQTYVTGARLNVDGGLSMTR